jgi:chemotaxis protein methyltransferase CheR
MWADSFDLCNFNLDIMKIVHPQQRFNFNFRLIGKYVLILLAAVFFFLFHFSATAFAEKDPEPKRILVIYSYHEGLPWEKLIDDSLRATLALKSSEPIKLNVEHADRIRYPDDTYLQNFVDLLRHKYSHPKMDVVVGVDDEATDILLKYGEELFPGIPIVFLSAERKTLQRDSLKPNMTSLLWGPDIQGSVDLISKMLPETRQILIITGSSFGDRAVQKLARKILRGNPNRLEIKYLPEISIKNLMQKVEQLPEHSVILYIVFSRDSEGKNLVPREILSDISRKANAPTFGILDTYLGFGIVGGSMLSAEVQGRRCAEIALRILGGESPVDIVPERTRNILMFDKRQLKRWGIIEAALPPDSIVRYREFSIWQEYRWYFIGLVVFGLIQTSIIILLYVQIKQRRQAESNTRESEVRYRTVADFTYDWEYWASSDGKLHYVSPSCERISGYTAQEFIDNFSLFREIIVPEDKGIWDQHYHNSRDELKPRELQFRIRRRDGKIRWIEHACQPVYDDQGKSLGLRASNRDITERKQAEIDLQQSYTEVEQLKNRVEAESAYLQEEIKVDHAYETIIGKSNALKYVLFKVEQVATTDTSVLILGETGTGKELIARAIHNTSKYKHRPLVKVNCAVLPSNLIESELFGHEKGAFTGADFQHMGRFELANGTTIFLDEIGELTPDLQAKLLRVLQDGEFERLGSSRTIKVDIRVIAATNRNLEAEMHRGHFREDLFYRLNVFPITVPPLRDRRDDIALLAKFLVDKFSKRLGKTIEIIPKGVMEILADYPWPGNVRELENVIERAVIHSSGLKLRLVGELKPPQLQAGEASILKSMEAVEAEHIMRVLEQTNWKVSGKGGAAEILGLKRGTLRARMQKLGIRK